VLNLYNHPFINNKPTKSKCFLHALVLRGLAVGYLHVTFPINIISHLAKSELLETINIKGNKHAFGFRETNHIQIHPKVSITGGTYLTFNFVLLPPKKVSTGVLTHQLSRVM
jgi:hypothetical protein